MFFNFKEFLDFIKYFLPASYTITASITFLIWLASQIDIIWQVKKYILRVFGSLFISGFLLNATLAVLLIITRFGIESDIYLQILIQKWYLISLVFFLTSVMVVVFFSPRTKLSNIAIALYVLVLPAVFVLHFYDFMQLTQVALSQQ